ncbi:MAG TPA: hypothetical protein VFA37_04630 [Gaiellaceae bacterium]|nr:hypothetical protein [Gaiellaceae bacterium]
MARILALLGALALAASMAVTAAEGGTARARPYSLAQVKHAFGSEGLRLSSRSLRVFVFRSERAEAGRTIEVVVGTPPSRPCRGCTVVRLSAPYGSRAHVQETEIGNVAVVYLASGRNSGCRAAAVNAALHELVRS